MVRSVSVSVSCSVSVSVPVSGQTSGFTLFSGGVRARFSTDLWVRAEGEG